MHSFQMLNHSLSLSLSLQVVPFTLFLTPRLTHLSRPGTGVHNGCWQASPSIEDRTDASMAELERYVTTTVDAFRSDPHVLWWEVYNEPVLNMPFSARLRDVAYRAASAVVKGTTPVSLSARFQPFGPVRAMKDALHYLWVHSLIFNLLSWPWLRSDCNLHQQCAN